MVNGITWMWPAGLFSLGVVAFDALAERELEELLTDDATPEKDSNPLVCASCGAGITSRRERLEINGTHSHTFTNPHGLSFNIGCFGSARNYRTEGEATAAWTWFEGYAWRVCVCAGCGIHLGWRYEPNIAQAGDSGFYGLILDRLSAPS